MLYVALSCLQGRPMRGAFDELIALADGVQLTPGNHPSKGFEAHVAGHRTLAHHGFSFTARRTPVWSEDGDALVADRSVHPPERELPWRPDGALVYETMYPGHHLGTGDELDDAMARGFSLAVDVSHLHIQREAGVLSDATLARVYDYDRIAEVHVSASSGMRDAHAPLDARTFGLAWARERLATTPVVVECYMHKLSRDERLAQLDLLR